MTKNEKTQLVGGGQLVKTTKAGPLALMKAAANQFDLGLKEIAAVLTTAKRPEVTAYAMRTLKNAEKPLADCVKFARDALLEETSKKGEPAPGNDKLKELDLNYDGDHLVVKRQELWNKKPSEALVAGLLASKKLPVKAGCDEVISYVPSEAKLQALVAEGKLTAAELQSCYTLKQVNLTVEKK